MKAGKNDITYHRWKASLLTGLVLVWFIFFALRWEWKLLVYQPDPNKEDIMEVNLGTLEERAGGIGYSIPEARTPDNVPLANEEGVVPIEHTENITFPKSGDEKVILPIKPSPPTHHKQPLPIPLSSKPAKSTVAPIKPKPTLTPIEKKVAPPPQPKAVFSGKLATPPLSQSKPIFSGGGVEKGASIQGNTNRGSFNGGNGGGSGINLDKNLMSRGLVHLPVFKEKFNQNGIIRVEVRVNKEGRAFFSRVMRSNTADAQLMRIIKTKISEIRFRANPSSDEDEYGYIDFNFKVTQ